MAATVMSTVDKALALLRYFSAQTPELGLSELARLSGYDKTTTLRCMTALERNDFVEQDTVSKRYRLGLAPINLARIREETFPVQAVLKRHLDELATTLGETTHATLMMGGQPTTVMISEPDRALRVHVDPSSALPLHATASGIAILSFMPEQMRAATIAQQTFEAYTTKTPSDPAHLNDLIARTQNEGVSRAEQTYEKDVVGTAAPIFGPSDVPTGSIAVAAVSSRLTPDLQNRIDSGLRLAAATITRELGGTPPTSFASPEELSP